MEARRWVKEKNSVNLEDAADDSAVGEDVEIVVVPLAGWARRGRAFEGELPGHRFNCGTR
jgi:hypothetical protein